jgi:CHAD domain-containing protein
LLHALEAYEPPLPDPARIEEHHAMRVAAKRLRYALEAFAPLYAFRLQRAIAAARRLQMLLGELHDCDVWISSLPEFLKQERRRAAEVSPGIHCMLRDRRRCRVRLHQRVVKYWGDLRRRAVWAGLYRTLRSEERSGNVSPGTADRRR